MNPREVLDVLAERKALRRGHFLLSSGLHSDVFVQKFRAFEHPRLTQRFGESLAAAYPHGFDVVASPAMGAIVLGFATALAGDARFVFAERSGGAMTFRRGFALRPHERVLVVEDVVTTGGSAREVVELVRSAGGNLVGVGALLDRSPGDGPVDLGARLTSLARLDAPVWPPDECPLCAAGEPLEDPGSRRVAT